jgi:hypothetical protein
VCEEKRFKKMKLKMLTGFGIFVIGLTASSVALAQSWADIGTVGTLSNNELCYTDGTDIICDGGILTVNGSVALDVSGTVSATAFVGDGSGLTGLPSAAVSLSDVVGVIHSAADTTPYSSLFIGQGAGVNDDGTNNRNVGIGLNVLAANTTGVNNVASGNSSLYTNTSGNQNIASGNSSLYSNTTGGNNIAIGVNTLRTNVSGSENVAVGFQSLYSNTTGVNNVASGSYALQFNTTGHSNMASGYFAQYGSTTGSYNVSLGKFANSTVTTGSNNIAIGASTTVPVAAGDDQLNIGDTLYGNLANKYIGIGITTPLAALDVSGTVSATAFVGDGSGLTGVGGSSLWTDNTTYISSDSAHMVNDGQALPVALEGASGARMIWYPAKSAFLAGDISATDATIGKYSTAMGTGTTASGVASTAMGGNTTASEVASTAMGSNTTASGYISTAMGNGTTASGYISTAMGAFTRAFGSRSTAMGEFTTASGYISTAMGQSTNASGLTSTAMGQSTNASGHTSTAMGREVAALGNYSFAIGLGNSSGVSGTYPQVTGANSMGIFMGDRINDDITADNTMAIMGGNVGVGTTAPLAALDVSGTLMISDGGETCNASIEGGIRYTAGGGVEYCDASAWGSLGAGGGSINDLSDAVHDVSYPTKLGLGANALASITFGAHNTAVGVNALTAVTSAFNNTAVGRTALLDNITGGQNTGIGQAALGNTLSAENTGIGHSALLSNTTGHSNTGLGSKAQDGSSTGSYNVAIGYEANDTLTTGSNNIVIGASATVPSATGDDQLSIGNTIYGDLANDFVGIGVETPLAALDVDGTVSATAFVGDGSGLTGVGGSSLWTDNTTYISSDSAHMVNDGQALPVALEGASGARMIWYPAKSAFLAGDISATDATIGASSTVLGYQTTASGVASTAMGRQTTASGFASTAMGGNTTASGVGSTAMGDFTTASGFASTAMGADTYASGQFSTAMGMLTTASGQFSTSMGYQTTASGDHSTAMGLNITASGDYSTAMGSSTLAQGLTSTAMGQEAAAIGDNSFAIGLGDSSGVSGTYPQVTGANSMGIFMGDRINDDVTDANTFALLGGQMAIGQVSANAALDVSGTVSATAFVGDGSGLTGIGGGSDISVADTSVSIVDSGTGEINLDVDGERLITATQGAFDVSGNITFPYQVGTRQITLASPSGFGSSEMDFLIEGSAGGLGNSGDVIVRVGSGKASLTLDGASNGGTTSLVAANSISNGQDLSLESGNGGFSGTGGDVNISSGDGQTPGKIYIFGGSSSGPTRGAIVLGTTSSNVFSGNVGVHTSSPSVALDVSGTLIIGDGGETCNASAEGGIRYTTADGVEYCNASAWGSLGGGGAASINDLSDAYYSDVNKNVGIGVGAISATRINNPDDFDMSATVAVGYGALEYVQTDGNGNTAVGYQTGRSLNDGSFNVAIGTSAMNGTGGNSSTRNVVVGTQSMNDDAFGNYNTILGDSSGRGLAGGGYNLFFGSNIGGTTTNGSRNILIGDSLTTATPSTSYELNIGNFITSPSMLTGGTLEISDTLFIGVSDSIGIGSGINKSGFSDSVIGIGTQAAGDGGETSVVVGAFAAANASFVTSDVIIGSSAATTYDAGEYNIIIGADADVSTANAVYELNIGSTLYGDLQAKRIGVGIVTPLAALDVSGSIQYTGTLSDVSDRRLKQNIQPLVSELDKIIQVNPVSFEMKNNPSVTELGVIAQELESVYPDLVNTASDEMGTKSVNYIGLIAPMMKAMQELKVEMDALKAENAEQKVLIENLMNK